MTINAFFSLDLHPASQSLVDLFILARVAALQLVAVSRSTGNDVVAAISAVIFFHFSFSPSRPFLIDGVLGSKNLFSES